MKIFYHKNILEPSCPLKVFITELPEIFLSCRKLKHSTLHKDEVAWVPEELIGRIQSLWFSSSENDLKDVFISALEWVREEYGLSNGEIDISIEEELEKEEVQLLLKKRKRGGLDLIYEKEMVGNLLECGKEWQIMKLIEEYSSSHNLPAALSVCSLVLQKS